MNVSQGVEQFGGRGGGIEEGGGEKRNHKKWRDSMGGRVIKGESIH